MHAAPRDGCGAGSAMSDGRREGGMFGDICSTHATWRSTGYWPVPLALRGLAGAVLMLDMSVRGAVGGNIGRWGQRYFSVGQNETLSL